MKPEKSITIVNDVVHADPNVNPTTVPFASLLTLHGLDDPKPAPFNSVQLLLDAPVGEGVTVTLYAVGDANRNAAPNEAFCAASTRFYAVASAVAVAGRGRAVVKDLGGLQGPFYVRVTGDTLTANATLHLVGGSN